jgi:hypothetical protein
MREPERNENFTEPMMRPEASFHRYRTAWTRECPGERKLRQDQLAGRVSLRRPRGLLLRGRDELRVAPKSHCECDSPVRRSMHCERSAWGCLAAIPPIVGLLRFTLAVLPSPGVRDIDTLGESTYFSPRLPKGCMFFCPH